MEWSADRSLEFIQNYGAHPVLWDPAHKDYKKRHVQHLAWERIKNSLSWPVSVDELKKKREALTGYYRVHRNKVQKSIADGDEDVFEPTWFAFSAMDSFLGPVYDRQTQKSVTIGTQTHDGNDSDVCGENEESDGSEYQPKRRRTESFEHRQNKESKRRKPKHLNHGKSRRTVDFDNIINSSNIEHEEDINNECEIFGQLIATKLRKLRNPATADVLMYDIHNLLVRVCIADQQGEVPIRPLNQPMPSFISQGSSNISIDPLQETVSVSFPPKMPRSPALSTSDANEDEYEKKVFDNK